jgi:hypothetical protein
MPKVPDFVELLRNPPDGGTSETIYDDLLASYNEDVTSGASAVEAAAAAIAERDAEISRLKAINYDLLIAARGDEESEAEAETVDDDGPRGIDALFA